MQLVDCLQAYATPPDYLWPMTSDYLTGDYSGGYTLTEVMQSADATVWDVETSYYTGTAINGAGADALVFASDIGLPITSNLMDSFTVSFLLRAVDSRGFTGDTADPVTGRPWWWPLNLRASNGLQSTGIGLGWHRTSSGSYLNGVFFGNGNSPDPPLNFELDRGDFDPYEVIEDASTVSGTDDHAIAYRWDAATSTFSAWIDAVKVHEATLALSVTNLPIFEARLRTFNWNDGVNDKWAWMSHICWWASAVSDEVLTDTLTMGVNGGCGTTPLTIDMQDVTIETSIAAALEMKTRVELDGGAP